MREKVKLINTEIRDEFTGCGPEGFDQAYAFALKVATIYKGAKVYTYTYIKSSANNAIAENK